jgi:hypothetical protein
MSRGPVSSIASANKLWILMLLLVGIAAYPWYGQAVDSPGSKNASGGPVLVSAEPISEMDGAQCEYPQTPQYVPTSATQLLAFAAQEASAPRSLNLAKNISPSLLGSGPAEAMTFQTGAAQAESADKSRDTSTDIDRAPARVVHDSSPTFSAVGLDLTTNEVYLQDENLYGLRIYDRTTNTPKKAAFSEPSRLIRGIKTRLEFNCDVWVDPTNGDVYSVNNDMVDRMVVFPRGAEGNVEPARQLHTPHRAFGIAVDQRSQELYMTIEQPSVTEGSVVVYRKGASGEERPIRTLAGEHTHLQDAHGVAIDTKNDLLFVGNHGATRQDGGHFNPPSITVYPLKADGDTAPLRIISGPKTQLNWPAHIYLDDQRGDLYVANDVGNAILVFHSDANGDVAPYRVIKGLKTGLKNPTGVFLDTKNDELWVSNMGDYRATVYPRTANGDVTPLRVIRSAPDGKTAEMIGNPGAVAYDSKREEILVPN